MGIGYLPQEASIFRNLSVEDNIKSCSGNRCWRQRKREVMLEELLNEFSIAHLRKSPSIALSGGERRRLKLPVHLPGSRIIFFSTSAYRNWPDCRRWNTWTCFTVKDRGPGVLITDHNVRETLDIIDRAYILHGGAVPDGRNAGRNRCQRRSQKSISWR